MWWNVVVWAKSWGGKSRHHQTLPQLKHSSRGVRKRERKKNKKKQRGKIHEEEKLSNTNSFRIFSWLFHTQHTKISPLSLSHDAIFHSFHTHRKKAIFTTHSLFSHRTIAIELQSCWNDEDMESDGGCLRESKSGKMERKSRTRKYLSWKIAQRLCVKIAVWREVVRWMGGSEENEKFNHFRLIHVYIAHSTTFSRLRELCFALSARDFHSRFEQLVFRGGAKARRWREIIVARKNIWFSFLFPPSTAQARYSLSCIKIELRGLAIRIIIVFFSAQNSEWLMITCRQVLSIVSGLFRLVYFYKIHFLECWREGENWEWEISRFRDVSRAEYTA